MRRSFSSASASFLMRSALFLGLDHALLALGLGLLLRVLDDPSGFRFGGTDGLFRDMLTDDEAGHEADRDAHHGDDDRDNDLHRFSS